MAVPASLFRPAPPQVPGSASTPAPAQEGNGSGHVVPKSPLSVPPTEPAVIVPVSAGAVEFDTVIAVCAVLGQLPW